MSALPAALGRVRPAVEHRLTQVLEDCHRRWEDLGQAAPELLEAAGMDGAGLWTSVREVILPIISPGIAATALICVIFSWNEFFFAVNLTAVNAQTMPVALTGFMSGQGLFWAKLSAASVLAALPVVICGWIAQNKLVRGLSFGAIK